MDITQTELMKMYFYEEKPIKDIAKFFGCTENNVSYFQKKYDLKKRDRVLTNSDEIELAQSFKNLAIGTNYEKDILSLSLATQIKASTVRLKVNDTWNEKFANKRKKKIENNIPMEYAVSVIENDKVEIVEPIKSTSKETSAIPIIGIRRVDDTVSIPEYEDEEACSFPLYSRVNISIRPGSSVNVPCNIKAKILNDDYVLVIIPDNTIAINNEVGILGAPIFFKNSYEEITIRMINYSHGTGAQSFNIVKGQKIAELTVVKSVKAEINEI